MKILVVTQYFYPENFRINSLCAELAKRGHSVTVLTGFPQYPKGKIYKGYGFHKKYDKVWQGVKIHRLKVLPRGKTPIGMLLNCLSFVTQGKKWVKRCTEEYDVVYVFEVSPVTVGLPAVAYKEKFGTPLFFNVQDLWPENVEVVLGIHNRFVIEKINQIVDRIYSASDKILCSSNGFVDNIRARGVPAEKLVFWPQFCDEPDFTNAEKPSIYSDDDFKIVFAGNIGKAQGLDLLVDTAALLKNQKNVRFYLVGDGRARKPLEKKVRQQGIENLVFVGRVSAQEADNFIHYADCAYLSFQNNEVFHMTIPAKMQSYMACGTPILAAVGGESAEIIRQANCGCVCERDANQLAKTIEQMMRERLTDAGMRTAARNFYERHYKKQMLIDELEQMLKEKTI